MDQSELERALSSCDLAIAQHPDNAQLHYNRANALVRLGQPDAAIAAYTTCLALEPSHPSAWYNRATTNASLQRWDDALADYDECLRHFPSMAEAWSNRAAVLQAAGRYDEALESNAHVLRFSPSHFGAHYNAGTNLLALNRFDEAIDAFESALRIKPENIDAAACLGVAALRACDWDRLNRLIPLLLKGCSAGLPSISPLMMLAISDDPMLQRRCAEIQSFRSLAQGPTTKRTTAISPHDAHNHRRLRIGYMSSDFREHPVAQQLAGLLESHDRVRFEIFGFANGDPDDGPMRHRIRAACDHFHEIGGVGTLEAADIIRNQEIDILVDLNGHTQGWRPTILADRPAPICVSYLGYAGTTGADFIDCIIGDPHVTPMALASAMSERIVQLPRSFWPTDPNLPEPEYVSRAEAGLPDTGFVFCCFNSNHKIRAEMFACWMRLLLIVPGSVLWLREGSDSIRQKLVQQAERSGVDHSRLVFAPRMDSFAKHLGRMQLAGLFLDTFPYNAHVTASDALWAGLPLVTLQGKAFASRVAASFLANLNLEDLITSSLDEYEAMARKLATNPAELAIVRERLLEARRSSSFFKVSELARDLESVYSQLISDMRCESI